MQDVVALMHRLRCDARLAGLVAHDWGGAIAWNVAALHPALVNRLVILNAPHPGTFLRDLIHSPAQQAASEYMRFLCRPDAAQLLAQDDHRRLWSFFESSPGGAPWLTDALKSRYRALWDQGLEGPLNYYRASPLRPPGKDGVQDLAHLVLPPAILGVDCPTLVLWGMRDHALLPSLLDGLDDHVASLQVVRLANATHWLVHEMPDVIAGHIEPFLASPDQPTVRGRL